MQKDSIVSVSFDTINKIRSHINRTEKQTKLLESTKKWLPLTSALDSLEDASMAVKYYIDTPFPTEKGGTYLFIYGLFQALLLQEDAINSISQSLFDKKINFNETFPEIYNVREIRNDVIGHPTNRGNKKSIYLAQHSLTKDAFYYIIETHETKDVEFKDVNIMEAINASSKCINSILEEANKSLQDEFIKYILKHRGRKMSDIFSQLYYAKQQIFNKDGALFDWGYSEVKNIVRQCEDELTKRYGSINAIDSYADLLKNIRETFDLIDNGIAELDLNYQEKIENHLLRELFYDLEELHKLCKETDDYFENFGKDIIEDHPSKEEIAEIIKEMENDEESKSDG